VAEGPGLLAVLPPLRHTGAACWAQLSKWYSKGSRVQPGAGSQRFLRAHHRHEAVSTDFEEPLESKLEEERLALGRLAQLSQRERKAPCKNFFWKTFTSC
uniref:Somatostatin/Cortistatin C-terminal domain-containing protein n=1 Tax=Pelusios castaneus TaxID=367368 RepID=A0A8C8VKB6_9SAUR